MSKAIPHQSKTAPTVKFTLTMRGVNLKINFSVRAVRRFREMCEGDKTPLDDITPGEQIATLIYIGTTEDSRPDGFSVDWVIDAMDEMDAPELEALEVVSQAWMTANGVFIRLVNAAGESAN